MTSAAMLARTRQTLPCHLPGCDAQLPVKVTCRPRPADPDYDVLVTADPAALLAHLREAHRRPLLKQVR